MSKKKRAIGELLEEALVPKEEQRFEIPVNWVWTWAGTVAEIMGGGTPKSTVKEYYEDGTIPWITPADLSKHQNMYISKGNRNITELGLNKSSAKMLPVDTVLLSSRAPIGYVAIAAEALCTNQGFKSFVPSNALNPKYLYWYLKFSKFYLESMASGSTFKELSGAKCKDIQFPLPPLNEQKRIAEKVERLLNKIDEAKQLIEEAKETFELRRAATLDKAFRGELTKKFRESQRNKTNIELENNIVKKFKSQLDSKIKENLYVLPEGWKWVEVNDLIENMTYGTSSKTNDDVSGTPIIRMGNIQEGKITKVNYKYLPTDHPDVLKFDVQTNDILFNRTNSYELVGKSAIITEEFDGKYSFASYLIRLRLIEKDILAPYIVQFINSHIGREMLLSMVTQQVGQANINSQKLASLMIPLPTIEEIEEINKSLKKLDVRERNTIKILELDSTVNNLKQSILSKAFKGKLGTTDPNDEPAIELLKLILQEK
ncbi:restriction endonuclease subunit S [Bacillus thuringiensis]|uniref:restriction endonuclease subunit S n=1 Tax=Bacillus thuringiensis TaxID=1428 RepID=UPI000BFE2786|nr:restriction endonuclease subunit S [Bacillus thuringiensis]PGW74475.1 restriction endonuclease subunit S [Bacillus thuringiensis]